MISSGGAAAKGEKEGKSNTRAGVATFSLKEDVAAPFPALSFQRRAWNEGVGIFQSEVGAGAQGCPATPTLKTSPSWLPPLPTVYFFLIKAEHNYSPVPGLDLHQKGQSAKIFPY